MNQDRKRDQFRQIKAMMWNHWIRKKRGKGTLMFEFILPLIYGGTLYAVNQAFNCPAGQTCSEKEMNEKQAQRNFMLPFLMVFFIPNIIGTAGTFIIKTMVVDKENKMRDTLKLMSLSHHAYAWSYLIF
jgi:hypothetical protein